MAYLIDTNIFLRLVSKLDPDRQTVLDAFRTLTLEERDPLLYYASPRRVLDRVYASSLTARRLWPFTGEDRKKSPFD